MSTKITEGQMDFLGLLSEYTDDQGATVRVHEASAPKKPKNKPKTDEPKQLSLVFEDLDEAFEEEERKKQAELEKRLKEEERLIAEAKKKAEEERLLKEAEEAKKAEEAKALAEAAKVKEEPEAKPEVKPSKSGNKGNGEQLFKQCNKCWCFDCKHNARNEGVPREMCGVSMPCPACKSCEAEDFATICEIGNAKEGCKFRAIEEGIFKEEETEEV